MQTNKPEVWMRGPIDGMSVLLQPIAFALLQAKEEIDALMEDFPEAYLWLKPAGMASPGFHLQHITGVLDRLFTYANDQQLSPVQLTYLAAEGKLSETNDISEIIVEKLNRQIEIAIEKLMFTDLNTLTDYRGVGRAKLPSTVMGLYTHAAEHTMRHVGQLLVTINFLKAAGQDAAIDYLVK